MPYKIRLEPGFQIAAGAHARKKTDRRLLNWQRNGDLQNPNAKKYVVFNWKNKGHNKGFSLDIARYRLYIDQYPTDTDWKNTEKYKNILENYSMNIGTGEHTLTRPDSVPWNIRYLLIAVRNY